MGHMGQRLCRWGTWTLWLGVSNNQEVLSHCEQDKGIRTPADVIQELLVGNSTRQYHTSIQSHKELTMMRGLHHIVVVIGNIVYYGIASAHHGAVMACIVHHSLVAHI